MKNSSQVAPLRVADEEFLVASTIERCPKTMMVRELIMNAIEAATQAPEGSQIIEIRPKEIGGTQKLCIWNTGPGMSSEELHRICNLAATIGKEKGLDENFGMGAKVASLPSNRFGLQYRSCKGGVVSEVILCQREGIYGRLRRQSESGTFEEVFDVTQTCLTDNLEQDWTEVVLYGNRPNQNTLRDPYDGNPTVPGQWLADYLYHRFYRLPAGLVVRFLAGTHKLGEGTRVFKTIPDRAFPIGKAESVTTPEGLTIHYFYDPPLANNTSHNKSVSGAITTDVSICAIIYKGEIYDLKRSKQWTLDAPIFGVTFGAKNISVHIELPDNYPVRPEAYRQFLRYREAEQQQVTAKDFADDVLKHRPAWLIDLINSLAPTDSSSTNDIRDELQQLLNSLRVEIQSPRISSTGDISVDAGPGAGARPGWDGEVPRDGKTPRVNASDLIAVPTGAKRATISLNAERAPEIIPLHDEAQIEEKGLKGKAARFYPESSQLFVNMHYPAVDDMRRQLELEYAAAPDPDWMRQMALKLAEWTIIIRVGRAVIYALAKQLNREWIAEDMTRAHSPESLSIPADDYVDALQNARRRMGRELRTAKQEWWTPSRPSRRRSSGPIPVQFGLTLQKRPHPSRSAACGRPACARGPHPVSAQHTQFAQPTTDRS